MNKPCIRPFCNLLDNGIMSSKQTNFEERMDFKICLLAAQNADADRFGMRKSIR